MNAKSITFKANAIHVGVRLDKALAQLSEIGSRSRVLQLFKMGLITSRGQVVKPSHLIRDDDVFLIQLPEHREPTLLEPYSLALEIVYEDNFVIVVNKPAGLVVHPGAGHRSKTLVHALLAHSQTLSQGSAADRPGIVHRLDKDTSGLIVIAKTDEAHRALAEQFKQRTIHRVYWAIVSGKPIKAQGTIRSYLKRHVKDRKRFASDKPRSGHAPSGKLAITHYSVQKALAKVGSLIYCKLETGRTHQIRVHLSELGHPILGDPLYGKSLRSSSVTVPRLALHAAELGFVHPITNKFLQFSSSWPSDLATLARRFE